MWANIFYAFLGAVFGVVLTAAPRARSAVRVWRNSARGAKRNELVESGGLSRWLIDYYDKRGQSLFYSEINGHARYSTVAYRGDMVFSKALDIREDWPLRVAQERATRFPIDERVIERRRRTGAVLFRSWRKSLYLDQVWLDGSPPTVVVRPCEYFEIASALIRLEDEAFDVASPRRGDRWRSRRKTPVRDSHLENFPLAGRRQGVPFSVGSNTVLVVKVDGVHKVAIQTRAETVITSPNAKAVIPNYGFEPNFFSDRVSSHGIVFYNFVREYLEELFDYEEIIGRSTWAQHPDWFLKLPEARSLLAAVDNGKFGLTYLGSGVECLSATLTIALLAVIEDEIVVDELMQQLKPNYEVAAPSTSNIPIEFVDIDDPRLGIWHGQGKFQPSTEFALSLALRHLREGSGEAT